jgi:hypothetical protein
MSSKKPFLAVPFITPRIEAEGLFEARTEAGKTAAGLDVGVHGR